MLKRQPRLYVHDPGAPAVQVEGVSVRFNGLYALQDVSFTLERGERAAVVGPNGAGKTTLFRVLAGVLPVQAGRVRLYGGAPERHICVGYVPQRSQFDMTFPANVQDVVMMGRVGQLGLFRWPSRRDHEIVRECLDLVGMMPLAERQIGELSGGQGQRVLIARALAQEAEIMLMDEPLTGLDINSQEDILQVLDALREREVTVLVATHDLNQAAQCFDRVLLLNRRLIGFGLPDTALTADTLREAYGDQLHVLETEGGAIMIGGGNCCRGGY
ncbi:MAG TPA: metal ABC transporter ATP-binding protein [Chloroflexi bacterium]|jgi:manganese/iron transport system ATP-binding protein|nr:metal ABC transporter ATP-binding protein [Chloroflexota bacterium]